MTPEKAQFLPFHAVNDFMLPEYRQHVLRTVLSNLETMPGERRGTINSQLKRFLKIPGFRNGAQSPLGLKVKHSLSPFERNADFTAQILSGWAELHPELRQQVYDLLSARGWELLPPETDRTKLPGFLTRWPQAETFEIINTAFHEKYGEDQAADNDISLMTVWLSDRLPYDLVETGEAGESEEQEV